MHLRRGSFSNDKEKENKICGGSLVDEATGEQRGEFTIFCESMKLKKKKEEVKEPK